MDTGDKDKFEMDKRNDDLMSYQSASMSLDWQYGAPRFVNRPMGLAPTGNSMAVSKGDYTGSSSCSYGSMLNSLGPVSWDQLSNLQNFGYSDVNGIRKVGPVPFETGAYGTTDTSWNPLSPMLKGGPLFPNVAGMLPQNLTPFPADSGFIERAARNSCFSNGNFSDMLNHLGIPEPNGLYSRGAGIMQGAQEGFRGNVPKSVASGQSQKNEPNSSEASKDISKSAEHGAIEGRPLKGNVRPHDEVKLGIGGPRVESGEDESSANAGQDDQSSLKGAGRESSSKKSSLKKRKRSGLDADDDQAKGPQQFGEGEKFNTEGQQKGEQNQSLTTDNSSGKQGKQGSQTSDQPKLEYIHVRARRGQATNSHSLAERVRREKISERMKFLQDLVPGCNKVTGKAVMLDEIINYVQSLQRQVEFLSMKLATVNPRLDFDMGGLLAKDILQTQAGSSSTLGFSPEMRLPYHTGHPMQPGLTQVGLHSMGSSSDVLRRMNLQLTPIAGGFKEPSQLPHAWDNELHNVMQMGFGTVDPPSGHEANESAPSAHMKAEM